MKFLALFLAVPLLAGAAPVVIDDAALTSSFQTGLGGFADEGGHPSAKELKEQLAAAPATVAAPELGSAATRDPAASVFLVGSVYKCGKCDKWHPGGIATAWALSDDGLMVTNHHVFAKAKGAAMGVCDREGNTYPVTEVLAANEAADAALFRVRATGLQPLALGPDAAVGSRVRVVSHPQRRFFMQTSGEVARYYRRPGRGDRPESVWMSITADYAKGSSGGPVVNRRGKVVGMVSSTQSIYYDSENGQPEGPLQMVVKNCVPVSAVRAMLAAEPEAAAVPAERP